MNMMELKMMRDLHKRELARLDAVKVSCVTCGEWQNQRCGKYGMVPPAEVKSGGCDEWEWDGIPFN